MSNKKAVFESLSETIIECMDGGLCIHQEGVHGEPAHAVWIPGRYVEQFLAECKRVMAD